jgi:hypothetical protein
LTPKKAFDDQKRHAEAREIPWEFSYEEWLELWLVSGKWHQRGRSSGKYCMARYGDTGPYSVKNCFICRTEQNQQQRWEDVRKILKEDQVKIVREWFDTSLTQRQVAEKFNVDQSYVSKLVNRFRGLELA